MSKMKIKKDDTVMVIAGSAKGTTGKVLTAIPERGQVIVEGVNIKKRHQRKNRQTGKGQIVDKAMPVSVSNVMVLDPKGGKPTRVGKKFDEKKKKFVRVAKRSGQAL